MPINEKVIGSITENVWSDVLGLGLEPHSPDTTAANGRSLTAIVHIEGAWTGAATVTCTSKLARMAASIMLDLGDGEPASEDVRDALAELVNIIGGNLKALLPGPSHLSLPTVVEGDEYQVNIAESVPIHSVHFCCEQEPLQVMVLTRDEKARNHFTATRLNPTDAGAQSAPADVGL